MGHPNGSGGGPFVDRGWNKGVVFAPVRDWAGLAVGVWVA
jgi:hypothetical protein